ncbi:MAG: histidinol dehydrogenase [Novosphingobium sp. 12-63-9]|nr:MAG: histidinol dehydrogenase [Novosphingobium sp. 12-63-9]OZA72701.1 MAG: histidinol dehydrogenase [Sphingomonadales bacterium 39-62-4]
MRRFDSAQIDFATSLRHFLAAKRGSASDVAQTVTDIVTAVRQDGLAAVLRFAEKFDQVSLDESSLKVGADEIAHGVRACAPELVDAINFAAARILRYHALQRPADHRFTDEAGVSLGWRWRPLDSVGIYVPGGRAAYPSTVLMNALPAVVAGVERIVMVCPPGRLDPAVLAAADAAGVTEIWRVGGAQAIAALAYGAGPIRRVDKIVGPGNAFVTQAKRLVYGDVGIDGLAGPSEIVVVADANNDPEWIAADLLSQAEHDPDAQCLLITDTAIFADRVEAAVEHLLSGLATAVTARRSWREHGAIIIAPLVMAPDLVDLIAPEHLELAIDNPEAMADKIRNAGAIFMGRNTPEAIGDYVAGSNHVLPTARSARFASGLSIFDFLKRTSLLNCSREAFEQLARPTILLTQAEGLAAHAHSVSVRL